MNLFAKAKAAKEKRGSKKGFTLVELIVVLVILAILMAILVPSLVKWIDKAKDKQILIDARTAYLAAQTIASEKYAKTPTISGFTADELKEVTTLAEVAEGSVTGVVITGGKVVNLTYIEGTKTVAMTGGTWGDVKDVTAST